MKENSTILVVGGGGREHAIIRKISQSPFCGKIYVLPGNAGMRNEAEPVDIKASDIAGITEFAKGHAVDFAIVAPDDPLAAGCVDRLHEAGIPCFGPEAKAAVIESSKVFSKDLMKKYHIPTAGYETFTELEPALEYVRKAPLPIVVKADGLALGKGVVICEKREDAEAALRGMMSGELFGKSGLSVVIEEFMEGPEVSVLSFTDGKTVCPMVSSMDHKRALDGDRGLNTGGMGTVAPNPYYTEAIAQECMEKIFVPTVRAMEKEGRLFKGCLYFGLMLTKDGPKVVEYNCRFGDPETQVVLPLLKSDLLEIMEAVEKGTLSEMKIEWEEGSACCVIEASEGYPGKYEKGFPITVAEDFRGELYFAGARSADGTEKSGGSAVPKGTLLSNGGRVLGVTAKGATLKEAIDRAYAEVKKVSFQNAYYRKDIGARAMKALNTEK